MTRTPVLGALLKSLDEAMILLFRCKMYIESKLGRKSSFDVNSESFVRIQFEKQTKWLTRNNELVSQAQPECEGVKADDMGRRGTSQGGTIEKSRW